MGLISLRQTDRSLSCFALLILKCGVFAAKIFVDTETKNKLYLYYQHHNVMIPLKEFDSLIKSLLYIAEEMDTAIKNSDRTLAGFTVNEMHCIDYIGKTKNPNVTKLAAALNLTRGGISRLIKKLITKKAVELYTSQTNKKEIYYKLTPVGKKVFTAHKRIHLAYHRQDAVFFKQFSPKEAAIGINFIKKYIKHTQQYIQKS